MTRTGYPRVLSFLAAVLAGSLLFMLALPAQAQSSSIVVNTKKDQSTPDDGRCSLREAIENANDNAQTSPDCEAGSGKDTITFKTGLDDEITLDPSLGPLAVTDPLGLTVDGSRASITVSGDDQIQVFHMSSGAKLTAKKLTVADGFANDQSNPDDLGDRGGGIVNDGGTLTVSRSTFSDNNAIFIGGGIANINGGTLNVINSTFSDNRAGTAGGAIVNDGTLEVTYTTFSGNDAEFVGGGIENANDPTAVATLASAIFDNSDGGNIHQACAQSECQGTIIDGGYNISDDSSFEFTAPTSRDDTEPLLSPSGLEDNGGPTRTIALQRGSPALDAIPEGENGCGTEVRKDQRGVKRPQGKGCDTGAFERQRRG